MTSEKERFFEHESFAVVGDSSSGRAFPRLTYRFLREQGKRVHAVDLGGTSEIEGDPVVASLADLPEPVTAAIVEVPRPGTLDVMQQVAAAGIREVWIHMGTDSPEALALCEEQALRVHRGSCAVMYTGAGSYHSIHRFLAKLFRRY